MSNVCCRERQRFRVRRIERTGGRVGPLLCPPARIEPHEPGQADVADAAARELRLHRFAVRALLEVPEELRDGAQLVGLDALADVDAVDAQIRQLADGLRARLIVAPERDAVEMDIPVDDVDLEHGTAAQVEPDQIVELAAASARSSGAPADTCRSAVEGWRSP